MSRNDSKLWADKRFRAGGGSLSDCPNLPIFREEKVSRLRFCPDGAQRGRLQFENDNRHVVVLRRRSGEVLHTRRQPADNLGGRPLAQFVNRER